MEDSILYLQTGVGVGLFGGDLFMVYQLSTNCQQIFTSSTVNTSIDSQSVKTKAYINNSKLQSLNLMQSCYLKGVSFVSLNY